MKKSFYAGAITESSAKPGHTHSALRGCFFHAKCTRVQNRESLCNLRNQKRYRPATVWPASWRKRGLSWRFEYYQQREALTVDHKGDDLQDVVSVADKRVEAFVKQRIQSAFPEDGFLGEESGARLPDARVLWVVDPIDGTSCFLNGLHTWCLSLAIVADGEPVIGVVYDPNHRELFHALRGHGAWLNDAPIRPHPATMVKEGVMGVGTSHRVTPADFSAVSAGAAQRRRHVYPQRLRGVDERLGGGGPVDWLLRAAHEPVGRLPGLVLMREAGAPATIFWRRRGSSAAIRCCWPARRSTRS